MVVIEREVRASESADLTKQAQQEGDLRMQMGVLWNRRVTEVNKGDFAHTQTIVELAALIADHPRVLDLINQLGEQATCK